MSFVFFTKWFHRNFLAFVILQNTFTEFFWASEFIKSTFTEIFLGFVILQNALKDIFRIPKNQKMVLRFNNIILYSMEVPFPIGKDSVT